MDRDSPSFCAQAGPRSIPFIIRLVSQRKILLLGGITSNGPISDILLHDIDYQTVTFI
jgi:hypothetical protein